jgi:hypothetical protein
MKIRLANRFSGTNYVTQTVPNDAEQIADLLFEMNTKGAITECSFVSPVSCIYPYGFVLRLLQWGFDTKSFRVSEDGYLHFNGKKRRLK